MLKNRNSDLSKNKIRTDAIVCMIFVLFIELAVEFIFPYHIALIISMVCPVVSGIALLCIQIKFKNRDCGCWKPLLLSICIIFFFMDFLKSFYYRFSEHAFFIFLPITLILGMIIGGTSAGQLLLQKKDIQNVVICFLVVSVIGFLVTDTYAKHLNYLLDTNEPIEYTAEIIEKKESRSSKRSKKYSFTFCVDGEMYNVSVELSEYKNYEVGDSYAIERYEGAFGKSFVMPK